MQLYYCKIEGGNFGDDMNAWFWEDLFPDYRDIALDYSLFGIGSILGRYFLKDKEKVVILGSGSGYAAFPDDMPGERIYGWVRGPLTAKNLGLDADRAITDPAVMCPKLASFRDTDTDAARSGRFFIPHVGTERIDLNWGRIARRAGLEHLSPTTESKKMIRRIAQAELVVTESLHGAIVADAFRTPWIGIAISPTFSSFKWEDWARSMDIKLRLAPALRGPKSIYAAARRLRSNSRWPPPSPSDVPKIRLPQGSLQNDRLEYRLRKNEKAEARTWVTRFRPVLEEILVRDLRKAGRISPQLSDEDVLRKRQNQIIARIEEIRKHFRANA